jgi:hypothetical protein
MLGTFFKIAEKKGETKLKNNRGITWPETVALLNIGMMKKLDSLRRKPSSRKTQEQLRNGYG